MSNTPSDAEIDEVTLDVLGYAALDKETNETARMIARAVLAKWAAPQPAPATQQAHQQEAQEPSRAAKTWCSYVAGMIGCYLNEPDESTKVQAIAGIIERRLWALPTPQPAPDCHHRPPCNECAAIAAQGGKA